MHFSLCSSSSTHSAGSDFSILWRVRTPRPHVTLHSLQSDQGDSMHGTESAGDAQARGQSAGGQSAPLVLRLRGHSRHSGIMHFSTSATSALQMEPSTGGIFTMRSRRLIPRPQVALQGSHSAHSVTTQLLGAARQTGRKKKTPRGR